MASDNTKTPWVKTNRGVATCMTIFFLVLLGYLFSQDWVYQTQRDGFRLGFFTVVAALAMLICSVVMIFDRFKDDTTPEILGLRAKHWLRALLVLVICYAYFYLAWNIDFLIISPIFLAFSSYMLGVRPVSSAIISGVTVGFVFLFLLRLIGIVFAIMFF
jgi:uncharacterized membrane protein